MSYGAGMKRLSPCPDDAVIALAEKYCRKPECILDLGCGRGERLKAMGEHFGAALFGIDTDERNIMEAEKNCPQGSFLLGDCVSLPYEDGFADLCLCECSFSLFSEPDAAANEIGRVLKKHGILILSDLCMIRGAALKGGGDAVRNVYEKNEIESFFVEKGFEILDFSDHSGDLAAMAAQMIFDGSLCDCIGAETAALLRRTRAGYGMWVMRNEHR